VKHFLSIADVDRDEIPEIFRMAAEYKRDRRNSTARPLKGKTWGLIFSKPSTRTRVSFEVGRLVDGAVIRTFAQSDIEEFAEFSGVPTINALTDDEHPCQILSDVFTIGEKRGTIAGKIVTFVGDGACNTARSWVLAAGKFDFQLRIAAPGRYRPEPEWFQQAASSVICTSDLHEAARDADVLYTDIWVSMGTELESARREAELGPYWINETIVKLAKPDALVMHCLPAHRGQEIDARTLEANASTIFDQAENRLHVQKAILAKLGAKTDSA